MSKSALYVWPKELVEALAENVVPLVKSKFNVVDGASVYAEPLKSKREVLARDSGIGHVHHVSMYGAVVSLNLSQQIMLLQLLSERFKIPLRHGSLKENFDAAYSRNGRVYKNNVLGPYWVFTREMVRRFDKEYAVGRVESVEYVEHISGGVPHNHIVFRGEKKQQPSRTTVIRYNLGLVHQKEIPKQRGYFDEFEGIIPIWEITKEKNKGKGYWIGTDLDTDFDENGLSAVGCSWIREDKTLRVFLNEPLYSNSGGALGIWTDVIFIK